MTMETKRVARCGRERMRSSHMREIAMKTVQASEFKAKCLRMMEDIARTGEAVVVTKNGRPVVTVQPYLQIPDSLFGAHADCVEITGDIIEPIDEDWNAAS
jgi:prevent-host-death family protein